ncbi:mitochondrial carrier [Sistotremastrum niveocremeum HHB9708]|uniref:Mitochondrial carrier n=2 Tax=Sistotremastraceae TaxID=3402574 RepID=A0A164TKY8_9AGAM|nr:mitochondrial carrier [Sistotremastrum niveocremeum HHB9708]KZT39147.1 mitochondrial carrier [Sistotremastrum suecicum HHB10207 ss-3]
MSKPFVPVEQLTPFGHALAGALGGVFANAAVYPLDTVKTRIQAATTSKNGKRTDRAAARISIVNLLLDILKEEGIAGYYKGFGASMLNTFSMQYAYFFFYSAVRSSYIKRLTKKLPAGSPIPALSTAAELLLGAVAGALAQIFTIPVSVIATRQQVGRKKPESPSPGSENQKALAESDDSFLGVAREIVREDGVQGLWLGIKPGLVLTVNPSITYGVFERVKTMVLLGSTATKLNPWMSFLLGAFSKSLATVVTYPYIMAKVRIQAGTDKETKGEEKEGSAQKTQAKSVGAIDILKKVLKDDGFLGWYKGMGAQITKAVLSQALLFMSKDQFEIYTLLIMNFFYRLRSTL